MEKFFRFSDYDVFACITSGLVTLAFVDVIAGTRLVVGANWSVSVGILTVLGCYVLGQLIATQAALWLEFYLMKRVFGRSDNVLVADPPEFKEGERRPLLRRLLPNYYRPLQDDIRGRLNAIRKRRKLADGQALFQFAFPVVKSDDITYARLSNFLNLYGFARNLAFVLAVGGVALIIRGSYSAWIAEHFDRRIALGAFALVASFGMYQRYLFFHRLYSVEVLTTFDALQRRPRSKARKSKKRDADERDEDADDTDE